MNPTCDPYQLLGVPRHADTDQIRRAFRVLVLEHHPDRNPGDPHASTRLKNIVRAYRQVSRTGWSPLPAVHRPADFARGMPASRRAIVRRRGRHHLSFSRTVRRRGAEFVSAHALNLLVLGSLVLSVTFTWIGWVSDERAGPHPSRQTVSSFEPDRLTWAD